MTHNSIDRFTGGTRSGALFTEELIWKNGLELQIELDSDLFIDLPNVFECSMVDIFSGQNMIGALENTLADLLEGRLALGGGSARGHGYFTGQVICNKESTPEWLQMWAENRAEAEA